MQNNYNITRGTDYLERIKDISILDICQVLGIEVNKRGNKYWCKLRNERTASCVLNAHKSPNTYCDFGGGGKEHDVIQFVSEALSLSRADAIKYLADKFNIVRERQNNPNNELANWEYEKLGLCGDLATKNFTFDIERQGIARVAELSQKYGMPMNDLRQKHPKMYEQLLKDHALPTVRDLRNTYYLSLISLHNIMKMEDFSRYPDLKKSLLDDIKKLQTAEQLLKKACVKTSIKAMPVGDYDPDTDLKKILNGEIKPAFGNRNYAQINAAAKMLGCSVKYRTIPCDKYSYGALDRYPHSAFFKGDKVVVGYLEKDHEDIKPLFEKMMEKAPLHERIANAETKSAGAARVSEQHTHHQAER